MVHAGCVFIAGIHPFMTQTSVSFESAQWNACMHWLDLDLYSHLEEFLGNGVRTHANSKGKSPLPKAQRRVKPVTLHHAGQRAQNTTYWAIPAPYDLSLPAPGQITTKTTTGKISNSRRFSLRVLTLSLRPIASSALIRQEQKQYL